jgi:trigger factor
MQTVETLNEGLKRAFKITIPARDYRRARRPGAEEGRAAGAHARLPSRQGARQFDPQDARASLQAQALQDAVQDGVQQLLSEQNIRPAMQPAGRS